MYIYILVYTQDFDFSLSFGFLSLFRHRHWTRKYVHVSKFKVQSFTQRPRNGQIGANLTVQGNNPSANPGLIDVR